MPRLPAVEACDADRVGCRASRCADNVDWGAAGSLRGPGGTAFRGTGRQLLDRALPPAAFADLLIASEPAMAGDESERTQSKLLVLDPRAAIQSVLPPAP